MPSVAACIEQDACLIQVCSCDQMLWLAMVGPAVWLVHEMASRAVAMYTKMLRSYLAPKHFETSNVLHLVAL
jgi:hypothetical protein